MELRKRKPNRNLKQSLKDKEEAHLAQDFSNLTTVDKHRAFMKFKKESKSFVVPLPVTLTQYERFQKTMSALPPYKRAKSVNLRRWQTKSSKDTCFAKYLSLPFSSTETTDQTLSNFARRVPPKLGRLQNLHLNFALSKITDAGIQELFMKSRGLLGGVKNFSINLARTNTSERTLDILIKHVLPYLGILEAFEIDLSFMQIDDQGLKRFWIGLRPFARNFKGFSFTMEGLMVSEQIVRYLAEIIFPRMTMLETLKLQLNPFSEGITDETIDSIFLSCHLNKIKTLKLEFQASWVRSRKITDEGFGVLACNLGSLRNLEHLELNLDLQKFGDDSLNEFWESLRAIRENLKTFKFSLNGISISDECFSTFTKDVLPHMSSLKTLEVNLRTELRENSYQKFFRALKDIAFNIEDLNLLLSGCEGVTDKNFRVFTKTILPLMTNIRKLRMDVADTKITGKSLEEILSKVEELKNLEFLEIKHEIGGLEWENLSALEVLYPGIKLADRKSIIYRENL